MPRDGRTTGGSSAAGAETGSWWSRNWKWFVPAGCTTAIVLLVGFVAALLAIVGGAMKSSEAYGQALAEARKSQAVVAALGTPIRDGWFTSGKVSVTGPSGSAALAIPIEGPKGKGKLYVAATKSAGLWTFGTLVVEVARSGERIDLLTKDGGGAPGEGTSPP